ncbi:MAG: hypothetical protein GY838_18420 [bacterium]|nr:hypothetical protein [bacterium]
MVLRKIMGLVACALIVGAASLATAGIPDLTNSAASRAYTGPETLSLFSTPDGGGRAFAECFVVNGGSAVQDGTIALVVNDGLGVPIENFPAEDMWIAAGGTPGLVACAGNLISNFNTNAAGETEWQNALFAGGFSTEVTRVYINGDELTTAGYAGLAINHNSPDINADGVVNLSDSGFFATDLFVGPYNYRSDFNADGSLNLSDAGFLGTNIGSACPAP